MTAINLATDIPSNINSLEQLAMWAISALAATNPSASAVEGQNYSERVAQAGIFYVEASSKNRFLGRISLEVSSDYLAAAQKTWKYAQDVSNNSIPVIFKSN